MSKSIFQSIIDEVTALLNSYNVDYRLFIRQHIIEIYIKSDSSELKTELSRFSDFKVKYDFYNEDDIEDSIALKSIFNTPKISHTGRNQFHTEQMKHTLIPEIEAFLAKHLDFSKEDDYRMSGYSNNGLVVNVAINNNSTFEKKKELITLFKQEFADYNVFIYVYEFDEFDSYLTYQFEYPERYSNDLLYENYKINNGKQLTIDLYFTSVTAYPLLYSTKKGFVEYWIDSLFSKSPILIDDYITQNEGKYKMSIGNLSDFDSFVMLYERIDFHSLELTKRFCQSITDYCVRNDIKDIFISCRPDHFGIYKSFTNRIVNLLSENFIVNS
jgi:hypothetical protein